MSDRDAALETIRWMQSEFYADERVAALARYVESLERVADAALRLRRTLDLASSAHTPERRAARLALNEALAELAALRGAADKLEGAMG
jgi:hypothetical protein